jgi:hypothetical protein
VGKLVGPDSIKLDRFAVLESIRVEFFACAWRNEAAVASVTAYAANDGAQRFYARHGFAPASVVMRAPL